MPEERPHLSLRFDGPRFDRHSIPIELLADLSAYRDLIKEVAKGRYKAKHPDRKRVPKAFEAAFKLSLKNITDGSAVAELVNDVVVEDDAEIIEFAPYFEEAKKLVDDTIRSATDIAPIVPIDFPSGLLPAFGKIGKHLKAGESIDFAFGQAPAIFTDTVRRTLVLMASDEIEAPADIVGKVINVSNEPEDRLTLRYDSGSVVGPFDHLQKQDVVYAFSNKSDYWLRLKGYGVFNKKGHLLRVTDTVHVETLDNYGFDLLTATKRIDEMARLSAGWCGGGEVLIPIDATVWAKKVLRTFADDFSIRIPYTFPAPTGEIQFEWSLKGGSLDVRLSFVTKSAELFSYSETGELEAQFDLSGEGSSQDLARAVQKLLNPPQNE